MSQDVHDIVDESNGDELRLVLMIQGKAAATAGATSDVVGQMQGLFGATREAVLAELGAALERFYRSELDKVTIQRLQEQPKGSRYFVASYIFRDFKNISEGICWYDLPNGTTGPDNVPALVRNKLRYEVHSLLTSDNAGAEALRRALR